MQEDKIPVVVGVTGHRWIVQEDEAVLRAEVKRALAAIVRACGEDTPVVMLNGLAEGADLLCAEVAMEMGIPLYAVLPRAEAEYRKSFSRESWLARLTAALSGAARVTIAPNMEERGGELMQQFSLSQEDYEYRQLGIYIASHSHLLLALWDGNAPKERIGCGTASVVQFALEHNYGDRDHAFQPGMVNDCPVLHVRVRERGGEAIAPAPRWLTIDRGQTERVILAQPLAEGEAVPESLSLMLAATRRYNREAGGGDGSALWKGKQQMDDYRNALARHYAKADRISFNKNQKHYNFILLLVAILGMIVAFSFMLYDDASLTFMIFPCLAGVAAVIGLVVYGGRRGYHANYIEYRVFAEALRIQYYATLSLREQPVVFNVCDLYAWTQKVDFSWIYKAVQALAVVWQAQAVDVATGEVVDVWLGMSERPTGQLRYHTKKQIVNRKKMLLLARAKLCIHALTIAVYVVIFAFEIASCVLRAQGGTWFWEGELGGLIPWRSAGIVIMGMVTAVSLIFSSYWGKLSFERKQADNERMIALYAAACRKWKRGALYSQREIRHFVREVAREEIVENGIWYSYVADNRFEWNF